MVSLRSTLLTLAIGSAMISRAAVAQHGASTSLIHTVTVTVPPRVKVQVAAFAPATAAAATAAAISIGSVNAATQGLSVSVRANQAWVLSVGSKASSATRKAPMRWSLNPASGFSSLTSTQVSVASGAISTQPTAAAVFFRATAVGSSGQEQDDASPVVLTMIAP
jgi:hypothetical protein